GIIYIANRSDGPIYDVVVTHPALVGVAVELDAPHLSASEIPPGTTGTAQARFTDRKRKVRVTRRPGAGEGAGEYEVHSTLPGWVRVGAAAVMLGQAAVIFTDALGRRWERTPDRRLRSYRERHFRRRGLPFTIFGTSFVKRAAD